MISRQLVFAIAILPLLALAGCAGQSKGAAFNECVSANYLADPIIRGALISECMSTKSFTMILPCSPAPSHYEWYWHGRGSASDPRCYRPSTASTRIATLFSPM